MDYKGATWSPEITRSQLLSPFVTTNWVVITPRASDERPKSIKNLLSSVCQALNGFSRNKNYPEEDWRISRWANNNDMIREVIARSPVLSVRRSKLPTNPVLLDDSPPHNQAPREVGLSVFLQSPLWERPRRVKRRGSHNVAFHWSPTGWN